MNKYRLIVKVLSWSLLAKALLYKRCPNTLEATACFSLPLPVCYSLLHTHAKSPNNHRLFHPQLFPAFLPFSRFLPTAWWEASSLIQVPRRLSSSASVLNVSDICASDITRPLYLSRAVRLLLIVSKPGVGGRRAPTPPQRSVALC